MGMFDDAIAFLAEHEDESESERNERTTLTQSEIDEIRKQHPGIPSDYLAYLKEIGWGSIRECQYMIYQGLTDPEDIFGAETTARFGDKRVLLFGDNNSGDSAGFLPDEKWKVVELWHDSTEIYDPNQTFGDFIREQMLIGEDGSDLRAQGDGEVVPPPDQCANARAKIKDLLANGTNINSKDDGRWAMIHHASFDGDINMVKALVSFGADVNVKAYVESCFGVGDGEMTALMMASQNGHEDIVKALITAKAVVNAKSEMGWTALHMSSSKGHTTIVESLIAAGADVNAKSARGTTPLIIASDNGHQEVAKALITAGGKVNTREDSKRITGRTALEAASQKGHREIVKILLSAGADINSRNKQGSTALYMAIENQHSTIVEDLIAAGADVEATGSDGFTPMQKAANHHYEDIVKILVNAGADVRAKNAEGSTALYYAVCTAIFAGFGHGDLEDLPIVKTLLAAGADRGDLKAMSFTGPRRIVQKADLQWLHKP